MRSSTKGSTINNVIQFWTIVYPIPSLTRSFSKSLHRFLYPFSLLGRDVIYGRPPKADRLKIPVKQPVAGLVRSLVQEYPKLIADIVRLNLRKKYALVSFSVKIFHLKNILNKQKKLNENCLSLHLTYKIVFNFRGKRSYKKLQF